VTNALKLYQPYKTVPNRLPMRALGSSKMIIQFWRSGFPSRRLLDVKIRGKRDGMELVLVTAPGGSEFSTRKKTPSVGDLQTIFSGRATQGKQSDPTGSLAGRETCSLGLHRDFAHQGVQTGGSATSRADLSNRPWN
jgi:hypothetical protein